MPSLLSITNMIIVFTSEVDVGETFYPYICVFCGTINILYDIYHNNVKMEKTV